MRSAFAVASSFLLFSSAAAFGQTTLPPLTAQVEVHVVNVDVSVTDKHGQPVPGLTKDDFEVFEDGVPQKITNFSVLWKGAGAAKTDATTAAAAPAAESRDNGRRMLIIVDNNFLSIPDRNRALDTIDKCLDGACAGGEWGVTVIGHAAETLQSFTSDKALVRAALEKARKMPSLEAAHIIDRAPLSERFINKTDIRVPEDYMAKLAFESREQTFRNLLTVQNTARAVVDTARGYSAEGGKKFILLLTGGMETNTTFTAYEKQDDPELRDVRHQIAEVIDAMVKEANASNFTVNVINARARISAPQHDVENHSSGITAADLLRAWGNDPIDVSDVDSIPLSIALGTGGVYLPSGDIQQSLQRIDALTSSFYSLGYSPSHNGDRQYHTIKVRVKPAGLRAANRSGYFDELPEDRLQAMLHLRTKLEGEFATLPVRVQIGSPRNGDKDFLVPVTAAMPLSRLTVVPRDQNLVGRVHVYCAVFDQNEQNIGFSHKLQEVQMPPQQMESGGDFRYTVPVHLHKGTYTIVITLRDELSNELGSASESISL